MKNEKKSPPHFSDE